MDFLAFLVPKLQPKKHIFIREIPEKFPGNPHGNSKKCSFLTVTLKRESWKVDQGLLRPLLYPSFQQNVWATKSAHWMADDVIKKLQNQPQTWCFPDTHRESQTQNLNYFFKSKLQDFPSF